MKIAIGADHRGVEVRANLIETLKRLGHEVQNFDICEGKSCDYPDVAFVVSKAVADGGAERGILVCGSGIGMCIAANKIRGVRAALVHDELSAEISRRYNDANVICLPADMLGLKIIDRIVQAWLRTGFDGGRHARRVQKISAIERGDDPKSASEAAS